MSEQLAHTEEIQISAERLQLDESERREILFEAVKDWMATDDIFELMKQPGSRSIELKEAQASGFEGGIPAYSTPEITQELIDRRRQVEAAFTTLRDGLFSEAVAEDASYRTLELRVQETSEKTRYLELCVAHQEAVQGGDIELAKATGDEMMELGKKFYGEVEPEMFDNVLAFTRDNAAEADVSDIIDGEEIRTEFLQLLPDATGEYVPLELGETYDVVEEIITGRLEQYLAVIDQNPPEHGTYTPEERVAVYELILQKIRDNGYEHNFKAVIDEDTGTESIKQQHEEIRVGRNRREPNPEEFKALAGHEALKHVLSRILGENSDAPMLGISLPGYNITEEGMAKLVEQVINGDGYQEAGINYVLTAGLNAGLNAEKMDKNDIFEIMWRKLYLFSEPQSSAALKTARGNVDIAKEKAEGVMRRMFRNGTGDVPGYRYQKDDVTYNNRPVWELLAEIHSNKGAEGLEKALDRFMSSKYNFFDEEQDALAAELLNS